MNESTLGDRAMVVGIPASELNGVGGGCGGLESEKLLRFSVIKPSCLLE